MAKALATKEKKDCWDAFSQLRRVEDCLKTTGIPFVAVCITCQKRHHLSYLDAGHCFAGRTNAKLLLAKFVRAQCRYCNQIMHGKSKKYERIIRDEYGDDYVDRQIRRMNKVISDRDIDWVGRTARYKRKLKIVMRKYGYKTYSEILQEGRG